ncbi:MAG: hypothetical protein Q4C54_10040 [Clostridia bacterium]|nr:hypothetical protein [Clostridia bacterium]
MKLRRGIVKLLKAAGVLLAAVLIAAAFYLLAVLGQPQTSAVPDAGHQPLLPSAPAQSIANQADLPQLLEGFPVPVLGYVTGAGPEFAGGSCYDFAFENGMARTVVLNYRLPDGGEITVQSIYPARAVTAVTRGNYRLVSPRSLGFAGLNAVRMENGSYVRLHAQNENGVYVVTLPKACAGNLSDYTRALHQFTLAGE